MSYIKVEKSENVLHITVQCTRDAECMVPRSLWVEALLNERGTFQAM